MKKRNLLNSMLVVATALAFAFSSCSSSDKNESLPDDPGIKLYPTKMTQVANGETSETTFSYTGDKATTIVSEGRGYSITYTLSYENDRVGKLVGKTDYEGSTPTTVTFAYDNANTKVTANYESDSEEVMLINKDGLLTSTKELDEEDYEIYTYDSNKNLIKLYEYYVHNTFKGMETEEEEAKREGPVQIPVLEIEEGTSTANYNANAYSPLVNVGLPFWLLTNYLYALDGLELSGKNLIADAKYLEKTTQQEIVEEGEEQPAAVVSEDEEKMKVTVEESKSGYPTKYTSVYTGNDENEEGEMEEVTTVTSYTVEYKEIKEEK